ncbi:hypothetical protein Tco_0058597 [Tanacetum coccineum]
MVAYLKKPEGSEGFYQIVDFLNVSHIRYALTENPIILMFLHKQFLAKLATARTLDNGEIELTATIDGTGKTVTEASVSRHLQLADADGISSLPTTEIFEQLSLMGQESMVLNPDLTTKPSVQMGLSYKGGGDSVERAATTATNLDAEQGSGGSPRRQDTILGDRPAQTRFERLSKQSNDPPLSRVNILGSREDSMTLQELMAYQEGEKGRKIAAIDHDPGISLVQHDIKIQGRYGHDMEFDFDASKEVSTADAAVTTVSIVVSIVNPTRNTRVPTANDVTIVETMVYIQQLSGRFTLKALGSTRRSSELEIILRPLGTDMASPILSVHSLNDWKSNLSRWITSYLTWIASLAIRD